MSDNNQDTGAANAPANDPATDKATTPPSAADVNDGDIFFGKDEDAPAGGEAAKDDKAAKDDGEEDKAGDKDDEDKDKDDKEKSEGAPEEYAEFTVPEGVELDTDLLAEFKPFAKDMNLSQEKAQEFVDFGTKIAQKTIDNIVQAHTKTLEKYDADFHADKEIGGKNADASIDLAFKAITRFGTPEFKTALENSGMHRHPEAIRAWAAVGKAISEDGSVHIVDGDTPKSEKSDADLFFNNTKKS